MGQRAATIPAAERTQVPPLEAQRVGRLLATLALAGIVAAAALSVAGWQRLQGGPRRTLAAVVLGAVLATVASIICVRRGEAAAGLQVFALTSLSLSLVLTWVAPVTVSLSPLLTLLPVVVAVPFVPSARFRLLIGASVACCASVVALGTVRNGVGPYASAQGGTIDVLTVGGTAFFVAVLAVSAQQNHVGLWERASELARARARLVAVTDAERRRLERDLHDGAQQYIAAAMLHLRALRRRLEHPIVGQAAAELQLAAEELREISHGIFPAALARDGLAPALRVLGERSAGLVSVEIATTDRYRSDVEAGVYFCCAELVSLAVRRSVSTHLHVFARDDGWVVFELESANDLGASGLERNVCVHVEDRVASLGGSISVAGGIGQPLSVRGMVPLSPRPERGEISPSLKVFDENVISSSGSLVLAIVLFVAAKRDLWFVVIAGLLAATVVVLEAARRARRDGADRTAILLTTVTYWTFTPVLTVIAPATVLYTPLLVLLPVLVGAPVLSRREATWFVSGAFGLSCAVAALGRFQSWTGLTDGVPKWAFALVYLLVLPMLVATLGTAAWENHVALRERARQWRDSRARLTVAADEARQRVEQALRDGPVRRLVAAQRDLDSYREQHGSDVHDAIEETKQLVRSAVEALEDLAQGVYPAALASDGLGAALAVLAARFDRGVVVEASEVGRLAPEVEAGIYFCCAEAMQNAVKHAGPQAQITLRLHAGPPLSFEVSDDGVGMSVTTDDGQGMTNMRDRIAGLGGWLEVLSRNGEGTTIRGVLPVAERSQVGSPQGG